MFCGWLLVMRSGLKGLGIDTTADDTCAAVVEDGKRILSNIIFSQSSLHAKFGGIVPQIASYEHLRNVLPAVEAALRQSGLSLPPIDLFSVGLSPDPALSYYFTSLNTAKIFSAVFTKPLVGVDHMEGHIFANLVEHPEIKFPFVSLTVAGGHTILSYVTDFGEYEILGQTRDDAAGEAFDKVARLLSLGYPGGPAIDTASETGNDSAYDLPRPMIKDDSFDFSFSGLKTAVWYLVRDLKKGFGEVLPEPLVKDIAASFRRAAVEVLVEKLFKAAKLKKVNLVVLGGGVAANDLIRKEAKTRGGREGLKVFFPSKNLCTDNAVGTAAVGYYRFLRGGNDDLLTLKHYRERPLMNWNLL